MAEPVEQTSQFPAPPSFYRLYADGPKAGPAPPPPVEGDLNVLAMPFTLDERMVPPLDVGRLYTTKEDGTIDIKEELLKLNKGLLYVFIELLAVLVDNPSAYANMVTMAIASLHNMQHLINLLRPDQARHTLEYILRTQIQQKQDALKTLEAQTQDIQQKIAAAARQLATPIGDSAESAAPG